MNQTEKDELKIFNYFITLKKNHQMATMEQIKQHFKGEIPRNKIEQLVKNLMNNSKVTSETAYGVREMSQEEFEEMLIAEDEERNKKRNAINDFK